ncbi:MAG: hypothetical protein ACOC0N_10500, partial [Chroococcales cyanobacterium]
SFRQFITTTVETIEQLCSKDNHTPAQLPTPSRNAYYFLKQIDLTNLPVTTVEKTTVVPKSLSLKNVVKQQNAIQQQITQLVKSSNSLPKEQAKLLKCLTENVVAIEAICHNNQVTPAALTARSRQAYAWMKFLTDEENLQRHLTVVRRCWEIASEILTTQQRQQSQVKIELTNYNGLYKYKTQGNLTTIQLSEGFIAATDNILEGVIQAALFGKTQQTTKRIRQFGLTEDYQDVLLALDLIADITAETAKGKCYDLEQLFLTINAEYFGGKLEQPRLCWNQQLTRRKFGHYEKARDRVVISQTLDDAKIPQFVVEFVLYHELLHKQQGVQWSKGRLMAHTPEFRRCERRFKRYSEAEQWLAKVARGMVRSC